MSSPDSKPKAGLRKRLLLLFGALVFALLLLEGAVRVRQWMRYGAASSELYATEIHPVTGLKVPVAGQETKAIRIDSRGYRSPEIEVPKPADHLRVAFLGGSTTFCAEVSGNDATWPAVTVRKLSEANPGVAIDEVNAGIPGYAVDSSQKNLEGRVKEVEPDVIVIYHAINDIGRDTRTLAEAQGLWSGDKGEASALAKISVTWYLIEKNLQARARAAKAESAEKRLDFDAAELAQGFAERLRALVRAAKAEAKLVAVATFSHRARRAQSAEARHAACESTFFYMPYMTADGVLDAVDAYNAAIREVARSEGVLLVEAADAIPGDGEHFNDSVHFKDAGARVLGETVAAALTAAAPFQELVKELRSDGSGR